MASLVELAHLISKSDRERNAAAGAAGGAAVGAGVYEARRPLSAVQYGVGQAGLRASQKIDDYKAMREMIEVDSGLGAADTKATHKWSNRLLALRNRGSKYAKMPKSGKVRVAGAALGAAAGGAGGALLTRND